MFWRLFQTRKGLTLVELLVALAILGIVLALGHTIYSFGMRSFTIGENQSIVQRDVRAASMFITGELRNATRLELSDTPGSKAKYHSIYVSESILKEAYPDGTILNVTGAVIDSVLFEVRRVNPGTPQERSILSFTVEGISKGMQPYRIESEVLLNNACPPQSERAKSVVYYRK